MYYSAKSTLKKCRQTEKETQLQGFYEEQLKPQTSLSCIIQFAYDGFKPISYLFHIYMRRLRRRKNKWKTPLFYPSLLSETVRTHSKSPGWAHESAESLSCAEVFGAVKPKGSAIAVKDSSRSATSTNLLLTKRTLRKCRRTDKENRIIESISSKGFLNNFFKRRSLFKGRWKRHLKSDPERGKLMMIKTKIMCPAFRNGRTPLKNNK